MPKKNYLSNVNDYLIPDSIILLSNMKDFKTEILKLLMRI